MDKQEGDIASAIMRLKLNEVPCKYTKFIQTVNSRRGDQKKARSIIFPFRTAQSFLGEAMLNKVAGLELRDLNLLMADTTLADLAHQAVKFYSSYCSAIEPILGSTAHEPSLRFCLERAQAVMTICRCSLPSAGQRRAWLRCYPMLSQ